MDKVKLIKKKSISKKKLLDAKVIELMKEKIGELSPEGQKVVRQEIDNYLKENGLGILILSSFNKNGETDLKINTIRTHEKHIKETFKEIFNKEPKTKQIIQELLIGENPNKNQETLLRMVR